MGNSKAIIGTVSVIAIAIGIFSVYALFEDDTSSENSVPGDIVGVNESISLSKNISNQNDTSTDEPPKKHVIVIGDKPAIKEK